MRKFAQTLFKSASVSMFNTLKFKAGTFNTQKALLTASITGYGFWFASSKVYNAENLEVITVDTEDNLQEG
jgi:hypothetical protein